VVPLCVRDSRSLYLQIAYNCDGSNGTFSTMSNESLVDQQIKDRQFEFKTGKAEFAGGYKKRSAALTILTETPRRSRRIPDAPCHRRGPYRHRGSAEAKQKLSHRGRSSKPLVSPEKTAADRQRKPPRAGAAREVRHVGSNRLVPIGARLVCNNCLGKLFR